MHHLTLVRRLREWGQDVNLRAAVICSFNYDLLAEGALDAFLPAGFDTNSLDAYLGTDEFFTVIKPHGSVNWANEFDVPANVGRGSPTIAEQSIAYATRGGLPDRIVSVREDAYEGVPPINARSPLRVPAMALPIHGKTDFACPKTQLDRLDALQGAVSRLLTIGWRAAEPHFVNRLRPLVRQDARVLVVAGTPAEAGKHCSRPVTTPRCCRLACAVQRRRLRRIDAS